MNEEMEKDMNTEETTGVKNLHVTNKGKKVLIGLALGVLTVALITVSINHAVKKAENTTPLFTQSAYVVLDSSRSETVLDDIFVIREENPALELDELQATVELSERIHGLGLDKYIKDLEKYEMPEEYNIEQIDEMIEVFHDLESKVKVQNDVLSEESRQFIKLCLTLEANERAINSTLTNDSYNVLLDYGTLLVKSKVLDACGFDADEYEHVKIDSRNNGQYIIKFTDPDTGKLYEVTPANESKLNSKGYFKKVIESLREWKIGSEKAEDTGSTYDGKRNKDILEGINELKTLTLMDCKITDKGVITVETKMSEVKEYIKTAQPGK